MRVLLLSVLSVLAGGCAPQARVMVLRPAEADIAGIGRLSVVDFAGPGETGRQARTTLTARLADKQHYVLVDQAELSRVEPAAFTGPQPDETRVIQAARQSEVDGVLTGQVVAYDAGSGSTLVSPPTVTLAFKLIDVRTSEVRAARQITRQLRAREVPDRDAALKDLMTGCAEEAAALITPHRETMTVDLARQYWGSGMTAVRRGNALAREGQWDEAAAAWQSALDNDPRNHVALHNLAMASLARGDHAAAASQLNKAVKIYADATYQQHRKLVAQQQRFSQAALAQVKKAPIGSSPPVAPATYEVSPPQPPQILPATGSAIPAALQPSVPADSMPQRLPPP